MILKVGDSASITKTFSDKDVITFANLTGDNNPIHLDEEYAENSRFKKRLVHGILVSGLISAVLGMQVPGPGCIYINQTINFRAPVFLEDRITATVKVKSVREDKPIVVLETVCTNQDNVVVIDGEAVLLVPNES